MDLIGISSNIARYTRKSNFAVHSEASSRVAPIEEAFKERCFIARMVN